MSAHEAFAALLFLCCSQQTVLKLQFLMVIVDGNNPNGPSCNRLQNFPHADQLFGSDVTWLPT
jgi:hypothetical protein